MTFIAGVIEQNLFVFVPSFIEHEFVQAFLIAFVFVALIEEGLKLMLVKDMVLKNKHFDEVMDGIIYTIVASLGFATLENLFYVFDGGIEIGVARAVLAVPAHALFSGIMGYYIGKARMAKTPWDGRSFMWIGFLIAVMYHGLYDFFLMTNTSLAFLIIPLLVLMFFHLQYLIKKAHFEDGITKQEPIPWDLKRLLRLAFGLGLVIFGIFYGVGIKTMIDAGQYQSVDVLASVLVYVPVLGGIFWAFRRHLLPKSQFEKEKKIKEDVKRAQLKG